MFDIGFWELAIILVVGLLVIGPEKLPGVARTIGTWVGRTRRFINSVKADVEREVRSEEIRQALERDASLDELKQIMNTDRFSLEEEEPRDYAVKAIIDEPKPVAQQATAATQPVAATPETISPEKKAAAKKTADKKSASKKTASKKTAPKMPARKKSADSDKSA